MRLTLILLIFVTCFSQSFARERGASDTRASITSTAAGDPAGMPPSLTAGGDPQGIPPSSVRVESSAGSTSSHLERKLSVQDNPAVIFSVSGGCVRPGDILSFSGQNLSALTEPSLVIAINNEQIVLKRISVSKNRLIYRLPNDERLQGGHRYTISVLERNKPQASQQEKLSVLICRLIVDDAEKSSLSHFEPGEILVSTPISQASAIHKEIHRIGHDIVRNHELLGLDRALFVINVDEQEIDDVIVSLRKKFSNTIFDKNTHYQPTASPRTYAPKMIAWPDISTCNSSIYKTLTIGIIDSYIDQTVPALAKQNITIKSFINKTEASDKQHGTAIAVILTGDKPELGFQGLLPGVKIMAASIIRRNGEDLIATTEGLVRSIDWMLINKVRLINISLTGTNENIILKNTFQSAIQKGLIIFSAAGNEGKGAKKAYPAALPGVIAVTAVDVAYQVYSYANQGKYIDFAAPGVDIWSTDNEAQGKYRSGTSFAAPHALAVAALYLGQNPSLSLDILYKAMKNSVTDLGDKGYDSTFGWGLVQAPASTCL